MTTSHQLAKILLEFPDLPIITHANNHSYDSESDETSHGLLKIGLLEYLYSNEKRIIIGNQIPSELHNAKYQSLIVVGVKNE